MIFIHIILAIICIGLIDWIIRNKKHEKDYTVKNINGGIVTNNDNICRNEVDLIKNAFETWSTPDYFRGTCYNYDKE
jgi:hypothetical protein